MGCSCLPLEARGMVTLEEEGDLSPRLCLWGVLREPGRSWLTSTLPRDCVTAC